MSLLDITEVVNDPDFTEPAQWIQRSVVTGADGVGVYVERTLDILVVPTAGDGSILDRQRDASIVGHSSRFYTTAPLSPGTTGRDADRLLWRGRVYQVRSVSDFSNWGQGFVSASCQLMPPDGGTRIDPQTVDLLPT